ncbi:hypothetical protein [Aurantibacillus circumpalustris]|uniref:hypothetical protein n=1 Tax=Aurantibacillus circumpalustris TaxID=3036359 RepID=UPI00295C3662|nr:hypothetical protein [Aurantibacillus circumpalustris]
MNKSIFLRNVFLLLSLIWFKPLFSQQNEDLSDFEVEKPHHKSKFLTGLYVGSYFANKYSASTYSGYGFDIYGDRNSFRNSFMYQKIKNEYGGGYGQQDYIAAAVGVDPGRWEFNESDMPYNMHYTPAILVGVNFKIPIAKRSSVLVNVNGTKLSVEGNFTISTDKPGNTNPALNKNIQTFVIRGGEQRLQFQLGFQQLFGEDEKFNFLVEGGLVGTLTKFDKNTIYINTLTIDLTYYVNQTLYPSTLPTRPVGFAVGAFAGAGINLDASDKFNVQLLYTPSFEKINIGVSPKHKFQHAIALRVYYKF